MNHQSFYRLISGQDAGVTATLARLFLAAIEFPYGCVVSLRNKFFDLGIFRSEVAGVPVVSVGNLTTGGTGKTPFVAWLARWFFVRGNRVAIVSRGYGSRAGEPNDEALELARLLPDVPHLQNRKRITAARAAIANFNAEVILLDDGFQHRHLHRNLDIVLIDALNPFGFGHLLPRGLMREPMAGLARAKLLVLSRANLISADERERIRHKASIFAPRALWCEVSHEPVELVSFQGEKFPLESAKAKTKVAAFCAIGNPAGFHRTLVDLGWEICGWREFPDHHLFSEQDAAELDVWARSLGDVDFVVCTQKDLVKIPRWQIGDRPLRALVVGIRILSGEENLCNALGSVIST